MEKMEIKQSKYKAMQHFFLSGILSFCVLICLEKVAVADPGPEYLSQTMECEWNINDPSDELVLLAQK